MQFSNVTLALLIFIQVVRCAFAHEAAPQLSNDTTNRKFRHATLGFCTEDGDTTCGVTKGSDWPLRTPPTKSGVSAAVRGHKGLVGGFQEPGATLAHPAQAQRALARTPTYKTAKAVPPVAGQATLHCTAQHPTVDRVENSPCTKQPMHTCHNWHTITLDTNVTIDYNNHSLTYYSQRPHTCHPLECVCIHGYATVRVNEQRNDTIKTSTTQSDDTYAAETKLKRSTAPSPPKTAQVNELHALDPRPSTTTVEVAEGTGVQIVNLAGRRSCITHTRETPSDHESARGNTNTPIKGNLANTCKHPTMHGHTWMTQPTVNMMKQYNALPPKYGMSTHQGKTNNPLESTWNHTARNSTQNSNRLDSMALRYGENQKQMKQTINKSQVCYLIVLKSNRPAGLPEN